MARRYSRFADGSINSGHRLEAAVVRALDAYISIIRKAERLEDELDQVTAPGVIRTQLSDEDSLVIAIQRVPRSSDT